MGGYLSSTINSAESKWHLLPKDLWLKILLLLDWYSVRSLSLTVKRLSDISRQEGVLNQIIIRDLRFVVLKPHLDNNHFLSHLAERYFLLDRLYRYKDQGTVGTCEYPLYAKLFDDHSQLYLRFLFEKNSVGAARHYIDRDDMNQSRRAFYNFFETEFRRISETLIGYLHRKYPHKFRALLVSVNIPDQLLSDQFNYVNCETVVNFLFKKYEIPSQIPIIVDYYSGGGSAQLALFRDFDIERFCYKPTAQNNFLILQMLEDHVERYGLHPRDISKLYRLESSTLQLRT